MPGRIAAALGNLPLQLESYEDAAVAATGLSDFGHSYYREGLDVLLRSLRDEAALTTVGAMMLQRSILLGLERRLYLNDLRKTRPELYDKPQIPPLIITGLPRSGTTFLHRLLAQDPAMRAPTLHELLQPLPLAEKPARRLSRLRLAAELGVFRRLAPGLDARHFTRADEPEECMFSMCQSFHSFMFWSLAPVYSHAAWSMRRGRLLKYLDHARILRALESMAPERRLLLKAPEHLGALDEIQTAMRGAFVVVCRRPPAVALASFNSLIATVHRRSSEHADLTRIGRTNLQTLSYEADRHAKARRTGAAPVLDLDYDLIASEPVSAAERVYRFFKLDLPPETRQKFADFAAANGPGLHGKHRYRSEYSGREAAFIAASFKQFEETRG